MQRLTSSAVSLCPGSPPPPDYYRNNLLRVLRFVRTRHVDLLRPVDLGFMLSVEGLSTVAQRLFARLIGRRGALLRLDRIDYAEVPNAPAAMDELNRAGLVQLDAEAPAAAILGLLTRAELLAQFNAPDGASGAAPMPGRTANATKPELIAGIAEHCAEPCIRARVQAVSRWLAVVGRPSLQLAQLLFFGDSRRDFSVFVLEDLGWRRYEDYPVERNGRLFKNRSELDAYLRARLLRELAHGLDDLPGIAHALAKALRQRSAAPSRLEEKTLSRALNRLGRWFERQGELGEALACHTASSIPSAAERRVRILRKMGDQAAAEAQLGLLRGNPANPQEADFAARFNLATGRLSRRAQPTKLPCSAARTEGWGQPPYTEPAETVLDLKPPPDEKIECFAMRILTKEGGEAWHLENLLPQGLAALAFWDVLFAPVAGAFLNPYQDGPLDLYWDDFAAQRRDAIAAQRLRLADPAEFKRILHSTFAAKAGVANALMSWRHIDCRFLARLLQAVPHAQLFRLACDVIENPAAARTGFPDLVVLYGRSGYEFVEVKGPNDTLRPAQRLWLGYLERNGFNARVLRFQCPPRQ